MSEVLDNLATPIVGAPMAGGPSTPELVASVSGAGGIAFLAAGYRTPQEVAAECRATRALTDAPFGVNLFAPPTEPAQPEAAATYAAALRAEGLEPGKPRHDDDAWAAKLDVVLTERPAAVSITFGCPEPGTVRALREAGIEVWITVTSPEEARLAQWASATALIAQGVEAGGHRGAFGEATAGRFGLLALLSLLDRVGTALPVVAAGGIATAKGVEAVLALGARAAQVGTALLLCPEAGTSEPHREAIRGEGATRLTRAFSGKWARAIENPFLEQHEDAPGAYPELHHVTAPIRAAARERGDGSLLNLWAGEAHELAREAPAAEIVADLAPDASPRLEELIAGVPVSDLAASRDWYSRLFDRAPDFTAGDELLWTVAGSAVLFIEPAPDRAGSGRVTFRVTGLDGLLASLADRGIEHEPVETYGNGVRHARLPDPDANAIAFAEVPTPDP